MTAEDQRRSIPPNVAPRALIILAIVLMLAQGLMTLVLIGFVMQSANEIAGGGIGRDELNRFGNVPKLAIASAWLTPFLGWFVGCALLIAQQYRWAWLAPVGAMITGTVLCLYFISTFEYVPPQGG